MIVANKTYTGNDPILKQIIAKISSTLIVEQIFIYAYQTMNKKIKQLYVLIRNTSGQGLLDSLALCNFIIQSTTNYVCYVTYPSEINQKIKLGNTRSLIIFHPNNLIYQHPEVKQKVIYPKINLKLIPHDTTTFFEKSIDKILVFEEGYNLYLKRGYLPQAAFMLHQMLELGFRTAENILIGKEKITHSLKNHQFYIHPFSKELGTLFNRQHEIDVMEKLDEAYKAARYDHDFKINEDELFTALKKQKEMISYLIVNNLDLIRAVQNLMETTDKKDIFCKKTTFDLQL